MTSGSGAGSAVRGPFETALQRLVEPAVPVSAVRLAFLSDPSSADMTVFRSVWAAVPIERRRRIARALLTAHEADFQVCFKPIFQTLLDDADADVRAIGVDGLAEAGDARLVARFIRILRDDPEPLVRSRAAEGLGAYVELGQLGRIEAGIARTALEAVADAAADEGEETEVRRRATASAGYADYAEAGHLIEAAIESGLTSMRAGALRAMGNSADERWELEVLAALADALPEIRMEAARAAGSLTLGNAVPGLVALVDDADPTVQSTAVWALGEIGGDVARGVLEAMLAEIEDPALEEAIEDALACMTLSEGEMPWSELMDERTDWAVGDVRRSATRPGAGPRAARPGHDDDDDDDAVLYEDEDDDFLREPLGELAAGFCEDPDDDDDLDDGDDDDFPDELDREPRTGLDDDFEDDLDAESERQTQEGLDTDPGTGADDDASRRRRPRPGVGPTHRPRRSGWLTIRVRPGFRTDRDRPPADGDAGAREPRVDGSESPAGRS